MASLISDLKTLAANPAEINVVDSEVFHKRICDVFDEISGILQKSAGPCGAPAVISNMPSYHITKDGYTIAKNLLYDNYKGYLDQVITYMIADICERLNNVVGDGTTAAILCTNKMYQAFSVPNTEQKIREMFFLPRDILYKMQSLKTRIINELMASAKNIKDLPKEQMVEAIREVVYISSNGNESTANMIANAYDTIGSPAIRVESAKDGITRCDITDGFEFPAQLTDKMYINSDDKVLNMDDLSIMMFDYKVGMEAFQYIIMPVAQMMKQTRPGKRLLVLAPSYDTVALRNIAPSLNAELAGTGMITLVLAVYPNATAAARKSSDDFSMLVNTFIITEMKVDDVRKRQMAMLHDMEMSRKNTRSEGKTEVNRSEVELMVATAKFILGDAVDEGAPDVWPVLGKVEHAKLGLETSVFTGFSYNENRYKANLRDAEMTYAEACDRYKITGDFNFDVDDCLARLNRLKLKTAVIYVGSDTEFSMKFDKDAMDDAVRAAQSAYFNGTVIGKHISMMQAILKVLNTTEDASEVTLLEIMLHGFRAVNHAILENGFSDRELPVEGLKAGPDGVGRVKDVMHREIYLTDRNLGITFPDSTAFDALIASYVENGMSRVSVHTIISDYEVRTDTALDLNAKTAGVLTFTKSVTNSAATDREILTASIDLIGLLLTSNQLIVAKPNT